MSFFKYEGNISSSKSLYNRALILQSLFPEIQIQGHSECDDVKAMRQALNDFTNEANEIYCGEAGTVLRFIAFRVSREPGTYRLTGSKRLLERPHDEMVYVLDQLGVRAEVHPDHILIQSAGWKTPLVPLRIHREKSSQFASGLLLSAWGLQFPLELELKTGVSEEYFRMTLNLLTQLGLNPQQEKKDILVIRPKQKPVSLQLKIEPDMSSAFTMAAAGALSGTAVLKNIPQKSLQPDARFIDILKSLNVPLNHQGETLTVMQAKALEPLDCNLNSTPDLFPVLAVVCAFAKGESTLWGAPHLIHKESNRIAKTQELLQKAGIKSVAKTDGLVVLGNPELREFPAFEFDTDHDHRMAFAAGLLKLKGARIKIKHPEVVSKSFPEFWQSLGVTP